LALAACAASNTLIQIILMPIDPPFWLVVGNEGQETGDERAP